MELTRIKGEQRKFEEIVTVIKRFSKTLEDHLIYASGKPLTGKQLENIVDKLKEDSKDASTLSTLLEHLDPLEYYESEDFETLCN